MNKIYTNTSKLDSIPNKPDRKNVVVKPSETPLRKPTIPPPSPNPKPKK